MIYRVENGDETINRDSTFITKIIPGDRDTERAKKVWEYSFYRDHD